jgi:hypothetical protein
MSAGDREDYQKPPGTSMEGYFASRRVLLALTGELPGLTSRTSLTVQGLAQFDCNGAADTLHTQYLELRFRAEPVDPLHLNLGGIGELAQEAGKLRGSAAAFADADWELPGALTDLLSGEFRWTGGKAGEGMGAFTPISNRSAGRVFGAGIGALMSAGLSYRARPVNAFSLEGSAAYFIRTDRETLRDRELDEASESLLLGGEVYGSLVWAPDPALRFSAGIGAFFPRWGKAFLSNTPVRWKADLGLMVSL